MRDFFQGFLALLCVVLLVAAVFLYFSRSRSILEEWAYENGFEILSSEQRSLLKGPFFLRSSRGQIVYYVTVRDAEGQLRKGWVRCGGFFTGLLSKQADVSWD